MGWRHLSQAALVLALIAANVPAEADGQSLAGRRVALDPGHGGSDPGASGLGLVEKDVNLDVALRARDLLQREGATVIMTRTTDATVSLADRVAAANSNNAHIFISVHSNACGGCGGTGTETYYHTSVGSGSEDARLAREVQAEMVQHLGLRDRGVKQADFYVLRNTVMAAVLVELGFVDTAADNAVLKDAAKRQEAARAILHAVHTHYGIAPHDPSSAPPPPASFTVTITAPGDGQWIGGVTPARGTSNAEGNLNWMRFLVDGSVAKWVTPAPHEWAWDTRGWADGAHALRLEGERGDGARAAHQVTARIDNTPPSTSASPSGTAGWNGWWRSAVQVRLAASDAGSGVAATRWSLDGGPLTDGTTLTVAGDGVHTVRYHSVDRVGNVEGTRTLTVAIDTTPPAVRLARPAQGRAYALDTEVPALSLPLTVAVGLTTVHAPASDATSGVDRVEVRVDGALRGLAPAPGHTFPWEAGAESLGDHALQAVAWDRAGNSASVALAVHTAPTTPAGLLATVDRYA